MSGRTPVGQTKRQVVFARDGYRCQYCLEEAVSFKIMRLGNSPRLCVVPYDAAGNAYEIDHIVPYIKTRDNSINNLVTACWRCNNQKAHRRWPIPKNFPQFKLKEEM